MKTAFSTLGCPDWPFDRILAEAERMGFDGLEIRGIENEMNFAKIPYLNGDGWKKTKAELKKRGLTIVNFGTSASFHSPDIWEKSLVEAKEAIDVAQAAGVPYIRIFGDSIPDASKRDETLRLIAEGWSEVYKHSENTDVTPLVEVHGHFNNVEIFKDIFRYFSHPKFAVLWDIEHSYKTYEGDFLEFFGFIRKYTKHVHVKDTKKIDGEWKLQNLGKGSVPIALHLMLLSVTNYNGFVSLEWEKKWHPELDDCEIAFPEFMELVKKILY
jgi:sugar phosphate isomerase/epimerase